MKHSQQAKNNSLSGNSLFIFLTRFFPSLASTLIVIYFSKNLSKEVYGSYQNFWIQLNLIYPIGCFGLHQLVITYSPSYLLKLKNRLGANAYYVYGLWLMVWSGIFAYLQYRSLHLPFIIPYLFMFSFALSFIFESILIVFRNFKTLVTVNILYASVFLFFHWQMLHKGYSIEQLFWYLLGVSGFRFLVYAIVAGMQLNSKENLTTKDGIVIKNVRSLWLHLGVYDIVQNSSNWIDKFAISVLLTAGVSAVYANGTLNIPFLPILLSAAGSAVLLQLGTTNSDDTIAHSVLLVNQSGRLLSSVMFPVFFFFLSYRYEVFDVLFSGKYAESVPLFLISILVIPVRSYSFTTLLQNRHKGAIINMGAISELALAILLMYPLYKLMGLRGLALSFVISTYLQAGFYLIYTARLLKVRTLSLLPYANWLLKLIVFALLFIGFHYLSQLYFTVLNILILGTALCVGCISVSLWIELKNLRISHGKIS